MTLFYLPLFYMHASPRPFVLERVSRLNRKCCLELCSFSSASLIGVILTSFFFAIVVV